MAASLVDAQTNLQIRRNVGTTTSGSTKVSTLTLSGASRTAQPQMYLDVSDAIGALIDDAIIDTRVQKIDVVLSE